MSNEKSAEEFSQEDFIVTLIGDDGDEIDYILMDSIEQDGHIYVYLVPAAQAEEEEQDLYIMEYVEQENGAVFNTVDNEVLLDELYQTYLESEQEDTEE